MNLVLVAILLIVPLIVMLLDKATTKTNKSNGITACCVLGFLFSFCGLNYDKELCENIISIAIVLAIPLMLFDVNLKDFLSLSKKTINAFLIMMSIVIFTATIFMLVGNLLGIKNVVDMSTMAIGVYIGGTQNLFSLGKTIKANNDVVSLAYMADSIFGYLLLFFITTFGTKIYKKQLNNKKENVTIRNANIKKTKTNIFNLLKMLILSGLCVSVGVLIELLINGNLNGSFYVFLVVTILGSALSFIKPIAQIKESYVLSEYLVLVFSLGLGMSINFSNVGKNLLLYIGYYGGIQVVSIIIHFIICKILNIDSGTALITSIAAIFGPPFVLTVTKAYGDDSIAAPGIICGSIGLAVANVLGMLFYYVCILL